jgi:hypothetical protein
VRTVRVTDVLLGEGNAGVTEFVFDVTISAAPAAGQMVRMDFATIDGTATVADGDYQPLSGTITFTSGSPTLQQITVLVNGDTTFEPNEFFLLRLSNLTGNAVLAEGEGIGVVYNDDAEGGSPTPTPAASPTPTSTPQSGIEGDVVDADGGPNGDGLVLANDVNIIRQFALGNLTPVNGSQYQRADINGDCGDGAINSADVTVARLYSLGLLTPPAACGPTGPVDTLADKQAISAENANRIIRAVNTRGIAGQQVTVAFQIDSQGDESAASFAVGFDPQILTNPFVELGSNAPNGSRLGTNVMDAATGRIGILVDSPGTHHSGTNQMITISFDVAAGAQSGFTPITFASGPTPQSVSGDLGQTLATTYQSGTVEVNSNANTTSITGRVLTADGRGLRNAVVTITDHLGAVRTATTSSFGYYRFEDIDTGSTFVIAVDSKRYRFTPRLLQVFDSLSDVDFVGLE